MYRVDTARRLHGVSLPTTLFSGRSAGLWLSDASECLCRYGQLTPQNQNISCSSHMQLLPVAHCAEERQPKKSHLHTEAANAGVGAAADLDVETLQVRTWHWNLLEVSINIQYMLISICVLIVLWFAWLIFNNIYCFFVFLLDYKCDMQQYKCCISLHLRSYVV